MGEPDSVAVDESDTGKHKTTLERVKSDDCGENPPQLLYVTL